MASEEAGMRIVWWHVTWDEQVDIVDLPMLCVGSIHRGSIGIVLYCSTAGGLQARSSISILCVALHRNQIVGHIVG